MIGAIDLCEEAGGWRLAARRGPDAARLFVGCAPREVPGRVSALFNLCAAAHDGASRRALGLAPDADSDAALRRGIGRDHAVELLHLWPQHLGIAPDRALLARVAHDPAGARAALVEGVPGGDLSRLDPAGFAAWLGRDDAPLLARVLRGAREIAAPEEGRADLPPVQARDIVEGMVAGTAGAGMAGAAIGARDASILTDHRNTVLLDGLIRREGVSLFVRIVARVLDLLAMLPDSNAERDGAVFARIRAMHAALPPGFGVARAARGVLAHRAVVTDGRVTDYAVLSPTDWHLPARSLLARSPAGGGLFEACLATLPGTRQAAELLLSALNPCVPARIGGPVIGGQADA